MNWLGRLSLDALPLYSPIAAIGAGVEVLAGVAIVLLIWRKGGWPRLWRDWLTTVDHKKLGVMYVVLALVMLLRGFADALLMRTQQAIALNSEGILPPDHFDQIFTAHGTIMIFFMAMPFLVGLLNIVVPLQIGARDVAFPRLNAMSLWMTAAGAALVLLSLVLGTFSTAGWTAYPPYSELATTPDTGVDYWIWSVLIAGVGSTMTGINFLVTILRERAPGMTLMRMPLLTWTALVTSVLMVFAFPALTVSTVLLALDRDLGMHFFTNGGGGNMMNYMNLFWIWGHPEVYILILPAFGIFSEVVATFSRKPLFGYASLVYATAAIGILSFTVWLHHFFTMGASANVNAAFGIATMVIAVPTGVKVFDWLFTMYHGRVRFTAPMLWTLGLIVTFVIGGATGVLLSIPPVDFAMHNSVFLVAHFHNMLVPGALFGYLAGYMYWFPKVFGFRLDERWGKRSFWAWIIGFYLAFMPLYATGIMGMPRRMEHYSNAAWQPLLWVAELGAVFIGIGVLCLAIQLAVSIRHREALRDPTGDPWDGRTLEWATASPPPAWNFDVQPTVHALDELAWRKARHYDATADGAPAPIVMPSDTASGVWLGALAFVFGFSMVWYVWWLAALSLCGLIGAVVFAMFSEAPEFRVIDAPEVTPC